MSQTCSTRATELRQLMEGFIQERLQSKIEKLSSDDPKYQEWVEKHQYHTWIAQTAKDAEDSQPTKNPVKLATHTLKPIHPSARGSNFLADLKSLPNHPLVGSHCISKRYRCDVTGDARYKLNNFFFLQLTYEGKTLSDLAIEEDESFIQALSENIDLGTEYAKSFAQLTIHPLKSSEKAKQLYWLADEDPTDNNDYHLLAPLYATSLAHNVFKTINHDRFSEESKAARKAKKDNYFSEVGYRVYVDLATQKLGGTKPQNISQLNSERGGNNYLLASLPPVWASRDIVPLLHTSSAFLRFNRRPAIRETLQTLIRFFIANPKPTMDTRNHHDGLIDQLIGELILFTHEIRQLQPGWSDHNECSLPDAQKQWLDPHHYQTLDSYAAAIKTWPEEIADSFARWLNQCLQKRLKTGDPNHAYWQKHLWKTLNLLQEDLRHV